MSKLTYRVLYYVLYATSALIVIASGLFCFGEQMKTLFIYNMDNPANADVLLYLMYGLFGAAVVVTIVAAILQFGPVSKDNPKDAIRSSLELTLLVPVSTVVWPMGSGKILTIQGYEGTDNVPFWLKLTDMFPYSIYFLLLVTVVTIVGSSIKEELS